jgi:hypothetical protein
MIKVFPISNLNHTVFQNFESLSYLNKRGVVITENIEEADFFIVRKLDRFLFDLIADWCLGYKIKCKPILVWTHEPRFCPTGQHILNNWFPEKVHIMNLYTHDVYFSNLTFYGKAIDRQLTAVTKVLFSSKPVAALATFLNTAERALIINEKNIDLSVKRQNLITDGYNEGMVEVYGKGWPDLIKISESRGAGWQESKIEILKNYQFNICLENTSYSYYCTEKIWDSIKSYCLPIYSSSNNKIYELFPRESFIDIDFFSSNSELFSYIKCITKDEYLNRMNTCIEVFNNLYLTTDFWGEKQKALDAIIGNLKFLYSNYTI